MSGELLGALGVTGRATPPGPPIYLICEPVDMRLGIDGLSACIQTRLATSPCSGGLYVFSNVRKNRVKLLLWDGTGVWLAQRRLHQGSFTWPRLNRPNAQTHTNLHANAHANASYTVSHEQWQWLTHGIDWTRLAASALEHKHWQVG
jgi:transposase